MPPVGFELTISAGKRPQTYALDRAATGTGISNYLFLQKALHVSDGFSVHHQELKTAYTATVYVKQLLLPAAIRDETAAGSSSRLTYTVDVYAVLNS